MEMKKGEANEDESEEMKRIKCERKSNIDDNRDSDLMTDSETKQKLKPAKKLANSGAILASSAHSSTSSSSFPSNKLKASSLLTKSSSKQANKCIARQAKDAVKADCDHIVGCDGGAPLDFSIKSAKSAKINGPLLADTTQVKDDRPLDLSCKRHTVPSSVIAASKVPRLDSSSSTPWNYSMARAVTPPKGSSSASMTSSSVWNGKMKAGVNTASNNKHVVPSSLSTASVTSRSSSSHGRQNPWQTQWINRSSEQTRDVFTCVWCKESFRSLQEMTEHMKASPRCGMAGMQQAAAVVATVNSTVNMNNTSASSSSAPPSSSSPGLGTGTANTTSSGANQSSSSSKEPMSSAVLAKNSMNLPRKLVRGQDVWLGRGAEQTRQILKCMWCGQSFKSLDDMTRHMRVTQHYTNIISQEQIISWKTPEDKLAQAQVNAVLTFKNAHYKEHIIRSMTEGGHGRRRQTRERRKKSLPVRKLLELERMELTKPDAGKDADGKKSANGGAVQKEPLEKKSDAFAETPFAEAVSSRTAVMSNSMITCDECNEKIDAKNFIEHIKTCKSHPSHLSGSKSDDVKSPASSAAGSRPASRPPCSEHTENSQGGNLNTNETGDVSKTESAKGVGDKEEDSAGDKLQEASGGSVLSAIERLIEKSFDTKSKRNQTTGILQRLGIDEEVCPPWQNISGSQSSHFQSWSSIKDFGAAAKDHRSISPVPSATSSSFAKENGSMDSSSSSSCEDSNSSASLTHHTPGLQLSSTSITTQAKFSFPISSIISNNEEAFASRLRTASPQSICSNSSPDIPATSTPPPAFSSPQRKCSSKQKGRTVSESSEEAKSKSPKSCEKKRGEKESKKERKRSDSQSSIPDRDSSKSPNKSSSETSDGQQAASASFHPLMELQKLLDKTDSGSKKQSNNNSGQSAKAAAASNSLLAFNWAFSEAATGSTSTPTSSSATTTHSTSSSTQSQPNCIKCAFCETQFVSKGAYRHHLSKVHFISNDKESKETEKSSKASGQLTDSGGGGQSMQSGPESPHSKFLKYTELAKQLSSKYV
ncbi:protein tiptop-like protein [Dinothrombium tinctorium]|uniref:Protein tiptop-like protein n=1 Tax=Dinothrombium tinctorium TaxID=1965070 RepID=A0A443RJ99_9ACAR|nr:protein tiptop-like protein [Dinothrombium tinctorium]